MWFPCLEGGALWWLRELLVVGKSHVSAEFYQNGLHCEFPLPLCQAGQLRSIDLNSVSDKLPTVHDELYFSVVWIDAGQVNLGCELDLGWLIGVVWAAVDRDTINPVLVYALCRAGQHALARCV